MQVHLFDGTYELFRSWFGAPPARVGDREIGARRGFLRSLAMLLRTGAVVDTLHAARHQAAARDWDRLGWRGTHAA